MHRRVASAALALVAALVLPADGSAQANACTLVQQTGPWQSEGPAGARTIHASGPLLVRCDAGEELRADSAVIYEARNEIHLFRRVDYKDPGRTLTSDFATYNSATGRLWATGSVVFTDRERGSTLRGPELEYFRPMEGRPDAQAIATGRPRLTVVPKDQGTGTRRRDPMQVDADRITTMGERFVTATGRVEIRGDDMNGDAQEAFYDSEAERLELRRDARATGENYELTGDYIQADMVDGALRHVVSRERARLIHERLRVTGPQLQLWFEDDLLQRMVAAPLTAAEDAARPRSVALSEEFRMEADSIEAVLPGQRLRTVTAIGTARAESWDASRVSGPALDAPGAETEALDILALEDRDLLFADTIIGYFREDEPGAEGGADASGSAEPAAALADPGEPGDPELERMVAIGDARSLYRSRNDNRPDPRPGINYVIGDRIDLTMVEGEVDVAKVLGLKRGVYLDPQQASAATGGAPAEPAADGPADGAASPAEPLGPDGPPRPDADADGDGPADDTAPPAGAEPTLPQGAR